MSMLHTLRYIWVHPLNAGNRLTALSRFIRWQIGSRLVNGSVSVDFVDDTRLLISAGMHGATMSIYTGLQEYEDMAFVLHFLRKDDLFVDIGANVGTYTILASGAVGARSLSIEPVPSTYHRLQDNIYLNNIADKAQTMRIALGKDVGTLSFTADLDTVNHVLTEQESNLNVFSVPVDTLDNVLDGQNPVLIKLDVEGYETSVLSGGMNVLARDSLLGVIMEINGSGARYGFSEETLHSTMLEFGFSTFAYSPLDRRLIPLEGKNSQSGNTLYLRNIDKVIGRVKTSKKFAIHQSNMAI